MTSRVSSRGVVIYDADAFSALRKAGQLAAATLDMITPYVVAGVTTEELDAIIHRYTLENGAIPAPLGYKGYPKACCISINHVVCHGIPSARILQVGDIVNIDVTSILDGWHGDTSRMYYVGPPSRRARHLVETTYEALMRGIGAVAPGKTLGDLGYAIQAFAESQRLSVVRDFCGHGIGQSFHAEPNVLHYGRPGEGIKLAKGMVFTIEPMLNLGRSDIKILEDGWTAVTRDRSLSAQFEHTVGVTENGYEIFTQSPAGYTAPPYA